MTENKRDKDILVGQKPLPEHKKFREDFIALMNKHLRQLHSEEILAIVSHTLGQLIACQDSRVSKEYYLELITKNIEQGNMDAINEMTSKASKN